MTLANKYIVWALRIAVGATFIFSGFVKAIDPWGLIYKISEYMAVWGLPQMPRAVLMMQSFSLSAGELALGVLLLCGAMRRAVPLLMAAFMAVMLPLTAYIAIANPVADCGCFGDALIISNTATFLKNIVLSAAVVYLVAYNHRVGGLYIPMIQWMPVAATLLFSFVLSIIGYNVQPLLDFRPYPVGTEIWPNSEDETWPEEMFIYERDGQRQSGLALFDGDEDVTNAMLSDAADLMILVVNDPGYHHIARASMANRIAEVMRERGGDMFAAVALPDGEVEAWTESTSARYPVVTADDTTLKAFVRGDAALVYVRDGVITWKTNLYSLPGDFPDDESKLIDTIADDNPSTMLLVICGLYLAAMAGIYLMQHAWCALRTVKVRK